MTGTDTPIAVVIPCRDARHLLWRSLACVAAQTRQPAQIVVLDQGSTDGLGDWLRVRWPGVEWRPVPPESDAAALAAAARTAVAAPIVAWMRPGDRWKRHHLEEMGTAAAEPIGTDGPLSPDTAADPGALARAVAALPPSSDAVLLDLRAAGSPAGLLDLLGLALLLGPTGRQPRAFTLADLSWPALPAIPTTAPLLITLSVTLDLHRAAEQLCLEQLLDRAGDRPTRLILRALAPTSPPSLSRFLDALNDHADAELWVSDAVSRRYATSLLGRSRVRFVPPPMSALAPILRELTDRRLVEPDMLGAKPGLELRSRLADHESWWRGYDPETVRRVGLALARALGTWRWLNGPLLQKAWLTTLVGWASVQADDAPARTGDLDLALFAALCGRSVPLSAHGAKDRDVAGTWQALLERADLRPR